MTSTRPLFPQIACSDNQTIIPVDMDLLASPSDDESTLRAVLAFIEGAAEYDDRSGGSGSSVRVSPSVSSSAGQPPRNQTEKYTTQLQRKKRAEVVALREEVAGLEALLAQIQRVLAGASTAAAPATALSGANHAPKAAASATPAHNKAVSQWREIALDEHRKRRHAELINGRLKGMLQRHRRLGDALLSILKKRPGDEVRCWPSQRGQAQHRELMVKCDRTCFVDRRT